MNEIRKILVRAPKELAGQSAILAALRFLYDALEAPAIEVVVDEGERHLFDFIDVVEKVHALPKDKDGPLGIFPWVHNNSNLFGIHCFFDFRGGASSASLGIAVKAAKRIGYATTLTKPMFNLSLKMEDAPEFEDERALKLCELLLDKKSPSRIQGIMPTPNEKEAVQLQSLNDYIFIAIRASEWQRHQKTWNFWFNELAGGNLVVTLDNDLEDPAMLVQLKKYQSSSFLLVEKSMAKLDLKLMSKARGVITDSNIYGNLAPYYGLDCAILTFDINDYPTLSTSMPRPELFLEREQEISVLINGQGERIEMDLNSSVDALFKMFNL